MMEFPRSVFKCPGPDTCQGGTFKTQLVADAKAFDAAVADGWHATLPDALTGKEVPKPSQKRENDPDLSSLSRGQMLQKAQELGLSVSPDISETKLLSKILAAQP